MNNNIEIIGSNRDKEDLFGKLNGIGSFTNEDELKGQLDEIC